MVLFYQMWKKCNGIQLIKNKMDFNRLKMKNHPPSLVNLQYGLINTRTFPTSGLSGLITGLGRLEHFCLL